MDLEKIKKLREEGFQDSDIAAVLAESNKEVKGLLDSGMSPKLVVDNIVGVPQEVPKTKEQLIEEEIEKEFGEGGPTAKQLVASVGTEIAIAEGAKAGGTALGAKIGAAGGPKGAAIGGTIGYFAGAIKGGVLGSIAAQKMEGRDDISIGRVAVDTTLNFIPGGKVTKGPSILKRVTKEMAKRPVRMQMLTGAALGPAAVAAEEFLETGKLPPVSVLAQTSATTGAFGGGMGLTGKAVNKVFRRMAGKTPEQIDEMLARGDADAIKYVDSLTKDMSADEIKFATDPKAILKYLKDTTTSKVTPGLYVGPKVAGEIRDAGNIAMGGREIGGLMGKRVQEAIQDAPDPDAARQFAVEYLAGRKPNVPKELKNLAEYLSASRKHIREYQDTLLDNHYSGKRSLPDLLLKEIERSRNDNDYLSRSYRFFDDAEYKPNDKQRKSLYNRLVKDGMSGEEANSYIAELDAKRAGGPNAIYGHVQGSPATGILKERKDISPELRSYLGEYTEPGQKIAATYSRLSNLVAYDIADGNMSSILKDSGLLLPMGQNLPAGWQPIKLRRGTASVGGEELAGPPELQEALNSLYASNFDDAARDVADSIIKDAFESGISIGKAVKVLGSPPAYAVQLYGNVANLAGMGMNPMRGLKRGVKTGVGQFGGKGKLSGLNDIADIESFKEAKELGLVPPGLAFADIQAGLKGGTIGKKVNQLMEPLGKTYSIPDVAFRVSAFENYKKQIKNAAPKANDKDVAKIAARFTNNTYQNYDYLNSSLKTLSRKGVPLSQYASFSMELMRNQFNQGRMIKKMISGELADEMSDELGVEVSRSALRKEGAKRLAFMTAVYGATAYGLEKFNRTSSTPEEEKAARESVLPSWDEQAALAIRFKDNGEIQTKTASYMIPQAQMMEPFMAGLRGESMGEGFSNAAQAIGNNLIGEGSFMLRTAASVLGNYDEETQRKISTDPDKWKEYQDRINYGIKRLAEPGIAEEYRKSKDQSPIVTGLRQVGIRVNTTTKEKGFGFRVKEVKEGIDNLNSQLSSARYRTDGTKKTLEEMRDEYDMFFNPSYKRQQQELIKHVNNLRTLKMSDDDILRIMKEKGVSGVVALNAVDGQIEDMPFKTKESISEKYDALLEQKGGEEDLYRKILDIAGEDRFLGKSLAEHHKKRKRDEILKITARDKAVRGLSVDDGEQARFVFREMQRSDNPDGVLRQYMYRKVIGPRTIEQIRLLRANK